jgi:hypothetical protein
MGFLFEHSVWGITPRHLVLIHTLRLPTHRRPLDCTPYTRLSLLQPSWLAFTFRAR